MKIRPLGSLVLAEEIKVEAISTGGIALLENQDPDRLLTVLAVGPKVSVINVGEIIILGKYIGKQVDPSNDAIFMVDEADVLGIVEN